MANSKLSPTRAPRRLQQPEATTQSPLLQLERDAPARDAPFGSSLATRRLLVAWLCVREYVAHITTAFVWISSSRPDSGLVQPRELCATRFGAMHSPSGSLLTLRVRYWTHWKSFDRHVPCADVVPRDLKVSRYRGCCVGRPTLLLRTESQQRFGFSKLS